MATTITRDNLRRLAAVKPERGRVLSVILNLDPTEFATPPARSTAVTSVLTEAAHRVDEADGLEERWCVLLVNRRNARFFVGGAGSLEETDRVEDDVHSQHDQGGWSQARYQRSVEKEKDDHLVHVAEVAFATYKRRGFDR